tara:strand:+ start:429 stop:749 length:321 start_codon:yes stop_codon:yes gene_type:complete
MDWDDLIDLIGQLNTDKEQQELLGRYIAIYNDYIKEVDEKEQIRKDKRAKYIRERLHSNENLRLKHNMRMRLYRANKKEEFERLKHRYKNQETTQTKPIQTLIGGR